MTSPVQLLRHGHVGELRIDRPGNRNAIDGDVIQHLYDGLGVLIADDGIGSILVTGTAPGLSSGLDLRGMTADAPPDWVAEFGRRWHALNLAVYECPKPLVSVVDGFAVAGGAALAFACDVCIVADDAFVHVSEVERGVVPPIILTWLHLRHGAAVAADLTIDPRRVSGRELVQKGVARAGGTPDQARDRGHELAERLAALPASAIAESKAIIRALDGVSDPFEAAAAVQRQRPRPKLARLPGDPSPLGTGRQRAGPTGSTSTANAQEAP